MNDKSSIYISIFNRKGGEGLNTKIIDNNNKNCYINLLNELIENEKPLIIYYKNTLNYFILTNFRIINYYSENQYIINLNDIIEVQLALKEEFNDRVMDKEKFTRLKIKTKSNDYFILNLEEGKPYQGLYQVLHFIVMNN